MEMGTGMDMGAEALRLLPEIWLLAGALVVLLAGSFLPRRRLGQTRVATGVALAASGISTVLAAATTGDGTAFSGSYTVDVATTAARLVAVLATGLVLALGTAELRATPRQAELCCLLLLAALGSVVLAGASDLLVLLTGFLLASVPLYAVVGLALTAAAAEATMKTYFFGSLFGIVLMTGVTVLYGVARTTSYVDLGPALTSAPAGVVTFAAVAVLGGLMFKAGAVPGHFWVPDAAQGAGSLAAAFVTTVPKIGGLVAAFRLVELLPPTADAALLVGVLAVLSMTLGNLAAFAQQDPRRLLGWSTVSQAGYLLVPVAVAGRTGLALTSLLVYLAGYAVTNVAAFAVLAAYPTRRGIAAWTGVGRRHRWLAGALVVSLLGLVGTPPTAVFVGKLTVSVAAWEAGWAWLAVAVLANSALSLFYYLRWVVPMVSAAPDPAPAPTGRWAVGTAVAGAAVSLGLGVLAAPTVGPFSGG